MPVDDADPAEFGLWSYVHHVAAGLGVGVESTWTELADQAVAYVALNATVRGQQGRDVALVWDGVHGWAIGMETGSGEDLLVLAWYGPDVLPNPGDVVSFTRSVLAGEPAGQREPPVSGRDAAAVRDRLRAYFVPH